MATKLNELDRSISGLAPGEPEVVRGRCVVPTKTLDNGQAWHYLRHDLSRREWRVGRFKIVYRRPCPANSMGVFGGGWRHQLGVQWGDSLLLTLYDRLVRISPAND
jgi:hypothetical protein